MFWIESERIASIQLSLIRRVLEAAPPGAINLALGELGYPMPQSLKDKATELLNAGNPCYTPNAGLIELREAIANSYSCNATANQICICNGAEEAIYISLMALINKGDTIAIPDPDYTAYPALCSMFDAKVRRLPFLNGFKSIDWDVWESVLSSGVKAVLLSSPSNPSGFSFTTSDAKRFGELCNKHGIIVIVDEIYSLLYFGKVPVSLQSYVHRLIRIGGISKSHCLSGWRIGWIMAPTEIAPAMIKAKQYISTCSHWLSQMLAIYALSEAGMAVAETIRLQLKQSQAIFTDSMNSKLPAFVEAIHIPEATPYIMLKTHNPDDLLIAEQLSKAGLICVPGSAFGETSKGCIRLNIGLELPLLEQGLIILNQF